MKCNKIKNNSVYLSVINSNIIEYIYIYINTKMSIGSGRVVNLMINGVLHSLGGTNGEKRSTFCLLRNHNRTERTGADGGVVFFFFFCTVRIVLFRFLQLKQQNASQIPPMPRQLARSPTSTQHGNSIDLSIV